MNQFKRTAALGLASILVVLGTAGCSNGDVQAPGETPVQNAGMEQS